MNLTEEEKRARNREKSRKWRAENPERARELRNESKKRHLESARAWKRRNPDKIKEYKRRDYEKRREAILSKNKDWNNRNKASQEAKRKEWYTNNRERVLAEQKIYRQANQESMRRWREKNRKQNRARYLFDGIKKTCKNNNIRFDLTVEWLDERLKAGVCEMTGLPFDMDAKRGPNSPSVDRRDPKGPYTMENCRMILWFLNRAMSNLGEEYALKVFGAAINRLKSS